MFKTLKLVILACLPVLTLAGCNKSDKTIVVGASSTPHALILEEAKAYIKEQGYELNIKIFDDYVLPNYALENGELDANYFQHRPYMDDFNRSNGTHLKEVLKVHLEPLGLYIGTKRSLIDYQVGDKIIVPSDKSNYDRAVALLEYIGLEKPNLVEVEAQSIPLMLSDCAYAVINGNYVLSAGVVDRCLITEDKDSDIAKTMANIIAVKEGNEENEKTRVLVDALKQDNIKTFISSSFGSSVIYVGDN